MHRAGHRLSSTGKVGVALALMAIAFGSRGIESASSSNGSGGTPVGAREVIGCTSGGAVDVAHGSRGRRIVALTFDDGPSLSFTPSILAILDRLHVRGTFFEEGRHVTNREALMRRILASGDEIANHSFDHPRYPGYTELATTNRLIRDATGFTPCLFRPPYGLIDTKVEAAARRNRLETVLWDVDSGDEKHPGIAAIRNNVLDLSEPGSIILMHDGGHHPQTVTALPLIIRGLRARGFQFGTVTEILGGHFIYTE